MGWWNLAAAAEKKIERSSRKTGIVCCGTDRVGFSQMSRSVCYIFLALESFVLGAYTEARNGHNQGSQTTQSSSIYI